VWAQHLVVAAHHLDELGPVDQALKFSKSNQIFAHTTTRSLTLRSIDAA